VPEQRGAGPDRGRGRLTFIPPQKPSIERPMRRAPITILTAIFVSIAALAPSVAGPQRPAAWSRDQIADLDRVSAYLNSIVTLEGSFVQIAQNGAIDQGRFYIKKPGKMRFDYQPPNPTMVVSDGLTIAVFNTQLNTVDRYPLSTTPLNILLSDHVDLKRNMAVVGIEHQQGSIVVEARSNDRRVTGDISIVLSDPELELRQWTVVDAQGLATTVSLRDVQAGADIPDAGFALTSK